MKQYNGWTINLEKCFTYIHMCLCTWVHIIYYTVYECCLNTHIQVCVCIYIYIYIYILKITYIGDLNML